MAASLALWPWGSARWLDLLSRGVMMGKAGRMLWNLGAADGSRKADGQVFL